MVNTSLALSLSVLGLTVVVCWSEAALTVEFHGSSCSQSVTASLYVSLNTLESAFMVFTHLRALMP